MQERTSLWHIMHHKIRWSDGIIIIHHEFVVVQPGTDFRQDLTPRQYPAERSYGHNVHRIITGRWLGEGSIVDRHLVPLPYNNFVQ